MSNLVEAIGDEIDFHVVTLDRDYLATHPYPATQYGRFVPLGKAMVRYMRPKEVSLRELSSLVREAAPNILYLNSLFDRVFPPRVLLLRRAGPARGIPTILAARGQLNGGAMGINPRLKNTYISALRCTGLLEGIRWQATSPEEARAIRAALGEDFIEGHSCGVAVAPNISYASFADATTWEPRAATDPLRVALLGRISPMKNIELAIKATARASRPVRLEIYGPVEDAAYFTQCEALVRTLPPHASVAFMGAVPSTMIREVLQKHDCFLSPTKGENFGHAIAEALAAGLPAIISDRTPWADLKERGLGAVVPLSDIDGFATELDRLAGLSGEEMRALHQSCIAYAKRALADPAVLGANRNLFSQLLSLKAADDR